MNCRFCDSKLQHLFVDLGHQPPSNSYLNQPQLSMPEVYYPLRVLVCNHCWLVQTEDYADRTVFFNHDYAYFSSASSSWLQHAANYTNAMIHRFGLNKDSFVIEVASNDGYLLKNFVQAQIPCLGIEPTDSTADAAEKIGVPVLREFFGHELALSLKEQGKQVDLILGNNVYAHVPDIFDFTKGLAAVLKPEGVITLEFPHLMRLIEWNQFDTIYHEHYSYLSLTAVKAIFEKAGLRIFDVEELPTHGGSLRIYGCLQSAQYEVSPSVASLLMEEDRRGMKKLGYYTGFQQRVEQVKIDLLSFLLKAKQENKKVVCYGAAAKGNTLLNYCGVKSDFIEYVADANAYKQGKYLPGSHIPITNLEVFKAGTYDYIIILPWNLRAEIQHLLREDMQRKEAIITCIPSLVIE